MLQWYNDQKEKEGAVRMIFCVEDDSSIRDLMQYTLNSAGFETQGFSCAEELYEALKGSIPELILLDIMLPGENGLSVLKKLRTQSRTSHVPIIMATAKGTEYDKVIGLDSGADDYLVKPFGMMELISRVKAVLRRSMPKSSEDTLQIGNLLLKKDSHTVFADGKKITLTLKEYELLSEFMSNIGYVFSREQLLQSVWGADFSGETRTVDVHIGTLRTKLDSCGDYIQTVRGVGYKMDVEK